jgi:hypothetical protein
LTASSAKCRGNIATLAALQQDHDDQEKANNDVNNGDENGHRRQKPSVNPGFLSGESAACFI